MTLEIITPVARAICTRHCLRVLGRDCIGPACCATVEDLAVSWCWEAAREALATTAQVFAMHCGEGHPAVIAISNALEMPRAGPLTGSGRESDAGAVSEGVALDDRAGDAPPPEYDGSHWLNIARTAFDGAASEIDHLRGKLRIRDDVIRALNEISNASADTERALRAEIETLTQEVERLRSDLAMVDAALARRPALDDLTHRHEKIARACAVASKFDAAQPELARLRAVLIEHHTIQHEEGVECALCHTLPAHAPDCVLAEAKGATR